MPGDLDAPNGLVLLKSFSKLAQKGIASCLQFGRAGAEAESIGSRCSLRRLGL
jgi:hypothetical protein